MAIPRALLLIAAGILVAGLLIGFFVGRATGPDESPDQAAVEQDQGGGGGGQGQGQGGSGRQRRQRRQACREALSLSQQVVGAQNQLLENRGQFARAVVADDAALIEELNAQSDQLLGRIASLQTDLERQIRRCL
jgi:hypothetical protein